MTDIGLFIHQLDTAGSFEHRRTVKDTGFLSHLDLAVDIVDMLDLAAKYPSYEGTVNLRFGDAPFMFCGEYSSLRRVRLARCLHEPGAAPTVYNFITSMASVPLRVADDFLDYRSVEGPAVDNSILTESTVLDSLDLVRLMDKYHCHRPSALARKYAAICVKNQSGVPIHQFLDYLYDDLWGNEQAPTVLDYAE